MERDPPLMPPDTSHPSQFATQSVTCNFQKRNYKQCHFFHVWAREGFELWPQSYEFSFKTHWNLRKIFSRQCTQDLHVSKRVLISVMLGSLAFNHAVSTSLSCSFFRTFIILMHGEPKHNIVTLLITGRLLADLLRWKLNWRWNSVLPKTQQTCELEGYT